MRRSLVELGVAAVIALLSVLGLVQAMDYRGQSAVMPVAITILATVCALVWVGQASAALIGGRGGTFSPPRYAVLRFLAVVAAALLYVSLMPVIGFFTTTAIIVPGLSILIGYRNWLALVGVTVIFVLILYGVFRLLLSVPLPRDILLTMVGL